MLAYRTFRNSDPPALVAVWQSQAADHGLVSAVSVELLERLVFSKLYFDYRGLVVALENGQAVGFAHAAFGPDETGQRLSTQTGATCMVAVRPDCAREEVATGLLGRCEAYLRQHGASTLLGGAAGPANPFYAGLYGGSEVPGVLDTDTLAQQLFRAHGYVEHDRFLVFRSALAGLQLPVDRRLVTLRRQVVLHVLADPPARTWWEACTLGPFDVVRFELRPRAAGPSLASATVRSIALPTGGGLGGTAGLSGIEVAPSVRRQGLGTLLVAECLRYLADQGCAVVETQTSQSNVAGLGLLEKFQFRCVASGTVFRKAAVGP